MFGDGGELSGVRVLVVDDEVDNRDLLAELLTLCGATVSKAASGNEAFDVFRSHRPHVIVSDVWMPNGDGVGLIRRIRALPPDEGGLTPAIAVSGGATPEQSLEAGFHFHLKKPIEPLMVLDCVRDFVRANAAGRAQWSTEVRGGDLVLRLVGHVTGSDMRGAVAAASRLLEAAPDGYRVVVDLRRLTGFDPSVGFVAETVVWGVRHKICGVVIVGGSTLAHLVSRSACLVIGAPCEIVDAMPAAAAGR